MDGGEATGEVFYDEFVKGLTREQIEQGNKKMDEYRAKKGLRGHVTALSIYPHAT